MNPPRGADAQMMVPSRLAAIAAERHVANGEPVVFGRESVLREHMPVEIGEHQRRIHRGEIEHGAAELRIRLDPAIGDGQRLAVAQQNGFVRTHAVRREFADTTVGIGRVVDTNSAGPGLEIAFGGEQQPAVGGIGPMPEEVPVRACQEDLRSGPPLQVERDGKRAGAARERDRLPAGLMHRQVVPARRQRDFTNDLATLGKDHDGIAAVRPPRRRQQQRLAQRQRVGAPIRQPHRQCGAGAGKQRPAINHHQAS